MTRFVIWRNKLIGNKFQTWPKEGKEIGKINKRNSKTFLFNKCCTKGFFNWNIFVVVSRFIAGYCALRVNIWQILDIFLAPFLAWHCFIALIFLWPSEYNISITYRKFHPSHSLEINVSALKNRNVIILTLVFFTHAYFVA